MDIESHWLSQQDMANACSVSCSAFQKWQIVPVARVGRKTFYTVQDVLANRLEHQAKQLGAGGLRKLETPEEVDVAQREAKIALINAQAEGQELKNAQMHDELVAVDLITWVVDQAGKGISRCLDAIPASVKRDCSKLRPSDMKVLQASIVKAQRAAADMNVDLDQYYQSAQ